MLISKKILFLLCFMYLPLNAMEKNIPREQLQEDCSIDTIDYDSDEEALSLINKLTSKGIIESDNEPFSLLHRAIVLNDKRTFKKLLKKGKVLLDTACTFWQERPLHLAAIQSNPYMLKKLIQKKADLNEQDMLGLTALAHAVEKNKERNVKILLSQQNIETQIRNDEGRTILEIAKQNGHIMIGKMLIMHCGLYTKHGLIAKEGLYQKVPYEIASLIASLLIQ